MEKQQKSKIGFVMVLVKQQKSKIGFVMVLVFTLPQDRHGERA
jgi:hypothetical protein